MKKILLVILVVSLLVFAGVAGATVLYFDDLPTGMPIPNGYGGLNWSSLAAHSGTSGLSGYNAGEVSPSNVVFNGMDAMAVVSGSVFDFNGAYLTGAWNNNLSIEIQGYNTGTLLYDQTVTASAYSPTWFEFNYLGVDELRFISFGGTPAPEYAPYGSSTQFAMDNFTFNEPISAPVPEPGTMMLLGSGLVGLVGYGRRRFKK